jgi:hypothetical protein
MTLKSCVTRWLACVLVAGVAFWTVGCAKEATTPAPSAPTSSGGDMGMAPSQAGSETKPGAEVPEPAPEKEATEKPAEEKPADEKPTEEKPTETKPSEETEKPAETKSEEKKED